MNKRELDNLDAIRHADSVIAVDPGQTTGVAHLRSDGKIKTLTTDFWWLVGLLESLDPETDVFIIEAPYLTNWPEAQDSSPIAYRSGKNHREAELLVEGVEKMGYDVVEYDPKHSGSSGWDSKSAKKRVVTDNLEWEGPANQHCIDALHLLLIHGVVG